MCARPVVEAMEARQLLALFLVTTADDAGPGSLRQAILDADSFAGPEKAAISFDIGTGGVQTIHVASPLPTVGGSVVIDGTTQPGFDPTRPTPMIELDGSNVGLATDGLVLSGAGTTVRASSTSRSDPPSPQTVETSSPNGQDNGPPLAPKCRNASRSSS